MASVAISWTPAASPGVGSPMLGGSKAPRPRPSPCRLVMDEHLLGEFEIGNGSGGPEVVEKDWASVAGRLRETNVARDHRREGLSPQVLMHFVLHLGCEARAAVKHREEDPLDGEPRVQALAHHV